MSKYVLRVTALGYLAFLLLVPVGFVFYRAFGNGLDAAWDAVTTGRAIHALELTLLLTAIAVPANTIVGIILALMLVRTRFRGRGLLQLIIVFLRNQRNHNVERVHDGGPSTSNVTVACECPINAF